MTDLLPAMAEARRRFMDLVAEVRPELHRYCARMTGSVFDGEDVVQDALAKAYYALAEMETPPPLRPWLFRIAHNTAMDSLRRYERRNVEPRADMSETAGPEEQGASGERVEAALEVFAALPPVQRSALALKDVLDHSIEETAGIMGTSVEAVKAALVRARANVAKRTTPDAARPEVDDLQRLRQYANLFNAHDWDGLRALFGEETQLDLVSRYQRHGRAAAGYLGQYAEKAPLEGLRAEPGWVDGAPVLAIFRPAASDRPAYFIQLSWCSAGGITRIRDFRYVPYIAREAVFERNRSCNR